MGGGDCFSDGGRASFLSWGWCPKEDISFDGGSFQKKSLDRGHRSPPPLPPTMCNPENLCLLEEMEEVNVNASAFMHLNIKVNK